MWRASKSRRATLMTGGPAGMPGKRDRWPVAPKGQKAARGGRGGSIRQRAGFGGQPFLTATALRGRWGARAAWGGALGPDNQRGPGSFSSSSCTAPGGNRTGFGQLGSFRWPPKGKHVGPTKGRGQFPIAGPMAAGPWQKGSVACSDSKKIFKNTGAAAFALETSGPKGHSVGPEGFQNRDCESSRPIWQKKTESPKSQTRKEPAGLKGEMSAFAEPNGVHRRGNIPPMSVEVEGDQGADSLIGHRGR